MAATFYEQPILNSPYEEPKRFHVLLDEVFDTERHLFYVACTRARDRILITGLPRRQSSLSTWSTKRND